MSFQIIVNYQCVRVFPMPPNFLSLYFFTVFCLLFISFLTTFPETWHKQKEEGLLYHFNELKTKKKGVQSFHSLDISRVERCHGFKSVTVEVSDLSVFGQNISSARRMRPVHFSLKWQIIAEKLLFPPTRAH